MNAGMKVPRLPLDAKRGCNNTPGRSEEADRSYGGEKEEEEEKECCEGGIG